jgi:DNA-binding transcriptional ArsR family regulator
MVEHHGPRSTPSSTPSPTPRGAPCWRGWRTGESTVGELAAPFAMSLAAASKHVKTLEGAGLLARRVEGRVHRCRLDPAGLLRAGRWLRHYERFWTERLDALDALLQAEDAAAEAAREAEVPDTPHHDERERR